MLYAVPKLNIKLKHQAAMLLHEISFLWPSCIGPLFFSPSHTVLDSVDNRWWFWERGLGDGSLDGFCRDIRIGACLVLLRRRLLPAELPHPNWFIRASTTAPPLRALPFFNSKVAAQAEAYLHSTSPSSRHLLQPTARASLQESGSRQAALDQR